MCQLRFPESMVNCPSVEGMHSREKRARHPGPNRSLEKTLPSRGRARKQMLPLMSCRCASLGSFPSNPCPSVAHFNCIRPVKEEQQAVGTAMIRRANAVATDCSGSGISPSCISAALLEELLGLVEKASVQRRVVVAHQLGELFEFPTLFGIESRWHFDEHANH